MVATPFIATALVSLGATWINDKFSSIATSYDASQAVIERRIEAVEKGLDLQEGATAAVRERVSVNETVFRQSAAAQAEFQKQTLARLDKMQEALSSLTSSIAGLSAVISNNRSTR